MEKMGLLWLSIEPRDLSNKNSKNKGYFLIVELNFAVLVNRLSLILLK